MTSSFGHQPNLLPTRKHSSYLRLTIFVTAPILAAVLILGSFSDNRDSTANITDQLPPSTPSPEVSRPPANLSAILSAAPAVGLSSGLARDSVRWFDEESGRAYEATLATGVVRTISDGIVPGFVTGAWIPGNEAAIIISELPRSGRSYRYVDYQSGSSRELESGIFVFSISSDASRIAYVVPGSDASNLVKIAAIDGSDARSIFRTRLNLSSLEWRGSEMLLLSSTKSDSTFTDLLSLSTDGELGTVLIGKDDLEYVVSDRGSVLISYTDSTNGVISLVGPIGEQPYLLGEQVAAHKCGWGSGDKRLLCGVPRDSSSSTRGSSLSASNDSAILIDLTGSTAERSVPIRENRVGIIDPVISSSGTRAAFIDLFDRRVHVLDL